MPNVNPGYQKKKVVRIPLKTYKMSSNNVIRHPSGHFRRTIICKSSILLVCPPYKVWILSDPNGQMSLLIRQLSTVTVIATTSNFLLFIMEN